jgi:hypothetical protein
MSAEILSRFQPVPEIAPVVFLKTLTGVDARIDMIRNQSPLHREASPDRCNLRAESRGHKQQALLSRRGGPDEKFQIVNKATAPRQFQNDGLMPANRERNVYVWCHYYLGI